MDNITKPNKKLVIIGGGLSAVYVLQSLYRKGLAPSLAVTILSAASEEKFGFGLAWDKDNLHDRHFLNMYSGRDKEILNSQHYVDMAQKQRSEIARKDDSARIIGNTQAILKIYRDLDNLTIRYGASGEKIEKIGDRLRVMTNTGDAVDADFVVGCPGHWQQYEPADQNPGVYSSPWPAKKFDKLDYNQPIAVQGSSLSAIDTVTTLSHNAGIFTDNIKLPYGMGIIERKLEGNYGSFTPHAGNENFRLDLYSRHGVLPSVLGYLSHSYGLEKSYKQVMGQDGHISLDQVFSKLKNLFLTRPEETPETIGLARILQETNTLDEAIGIFQAEFKKYTPHERLAYELNNALKSFVDERPLPIQQFCRHVDEVVEYAYRYFSAEDQQRYMKDIHPFIARYAFGMMISNAQEVLSLMNAGRLDIHAVGFESSLRNKMEGDVILPGAEIRYTDNDGKTAKKYHKVVIRATGDDMRQLPESSPLMKNLFASGIADEIVFPYSDPELGRKLLEKQNQSGSAANKTADKYIFKGGPGSYFYRAGGIRLTRDWEVTNELNPNLVPELSPNGSNIFMIGPPAAGYTPLLQGFGAIRPQADKIVDTIATRIGFQQTSGEVFGVGKFDIHPSNILAARKDEENDLTFVRLDNSVITLVIGPFPEDATTPQIIAKYGDAIRRNGEQEMYGMVGKSALPGYILDAVNSKLARAQM